MIEGMLTASPPDPVLLENCSPSWVIDLIPCKFYWYETDARKEEFFRSQKTYKNSTYPPEKEKEGKGYLFFIASRTRVRFSVSRQPRYTLFGNKLKIYLEIGNEKKLRTLTVDPAKHRLSGRPHVLTTQKFITFVYEDGIKLTLDVHDFLLCYDIRLGIDTRIHRVGFTENPVEAASASEALLETVPSDENDLFIYYTRYVLTVLGRRALPASPLSHPAPEGKVLETALALYFDTVPESRESLEALLIRNAVPMLTFHHEADPGNEYFTLGSDTVEPSTCHLFTVMTDDGIRITSFTPTGR